VRGGGRGWGSLCFGRSLVLAVSGFHDDGSDAVAFQMLQQIGEAGPFLDAVRAGYGLVVVPVDDLEASTLGEGLNRRALVGRVRAPLQESVPASVRRWIRMARYIGTLRPITPSSQSHRALASSSLC
jgi:hypothetical protein